MQSESNKSNNLQKNTLNPEQLAAVRNIEGPVMIIAGPGSGKTRVITERIAHLINSGVDSQNILALTFTNKAAKEMKMRIRSLTNNEDSESIWMGTFHSIFARILRQEAAVIGYSNNFTIYDNEDSNKIIRRIIKDWNLDKDTYNPKFIFSRISFMKNNLISPEDYNMHDTLKEQDKRSKRVDFLKIYQKYCQTCRDSNAMDFDDLLINTHKLFQENSSITSYYQETFKYILIDEYQDTNKAQDKIIKQIGTKHKNVCIVGDDSQSIYSFRGANINNMLNFKKFYKNVKEFKLEQNYRSTQNIVNAANSLIAYNKHKIDKTIFSKNEEGDKIRLFEYSNGREEGTKISSMIEKSILKGGKKSDHAILYRTNSQSKIIEDGLRKKGIHYRIFGGLSFYQRKEVKDVMAFLKLILNHDDDESLIRIINYPTRGIGNTTINKIRTRAEDKKKTIWQILKSDDFHDIKLTNSAKKNVSFFINIMKDLFQKIDNNIFEIMEFLIDRTGIIRRLKDDPTADNINRLENIGELINSTKLFSMRKNNNHLMDFINEISLDENKADEPINEDHVSLMTIHQSKGLEFSHVYVLGLENGLFPSQRNMRDRKMIEEERRLFYVAITRAIKTVVLSYAISRFQFGTINKTEKSLFLDEINYFFIEKVKQNYISKIGAHSLRNPPKIDNRKLKKIRLNSQNTYFRKGLEVGQSIIHNVFGKGEIRKIDNSDGNQKITVFFSASGEKILLTKFAKFEILT